MPSFLTVSLVFTPDNIDRAGAHLRALTVFWHGPIVVYCSGVGTLPFVCEAVVDRDRITILHDYDAHSLGYGMNRICEQVRTRWFLVLDGDILPDTDAVTALEEKLKTFPEDTMIGAVQTLVTNSHPSRFAHYEWVSDTLSYLAHGLEEAGWYERNTIDMATERDLQRLQGGARAFDTAAYRAVGGALDALGGIDRGLGRRLVANGKTIRFLPEVVFAHPYPSTIGGVIRRKWKQSRASFRNRKINPETRKGSFMACLKMLKSCFFVPKHFKESISGRLYYVVAMGALAIGILIRDVLDRVGVYRIGESVSARSVSDNKAFTNQ